MKNIEKFVKFYSFANHASISFCAKSLLNSQFHVLYTISLFHLKIQLSSHIFKAHITSSKYHTNEIHGI